MPFQITAGSVTLVQLRHRRKGPTTQGRRRRGKEGLACRQAQECTLRRAPQVLRDGTGRATDSAPVFGAGADGHTASPGQRRRLIPLRRISYSPARPTGRKNRPTRLRASFRVHSSATASPSIASPRCPRVPTRLRSGWGRLRGPGRPGEYRGSQQSGARRERQRRQSSDRQ